MANQRMLTRVTNTAEARRLPYIPPNGKEMEENEEVVIPGAIETMIHMGFDSDVQDEYIYDLLNFRIDVETEGFGGGGGAEDAHEATIGNGTDTVFEIDAGFLTASATVLVYDLLSGSIIQTSQIELSTPNITSVRLTFSPAPAASQIKVFIFE
jgi:hypothetical protein